MRSEGAVKSKNYTHYSKCNIATAALDSAVILVSLTIIYPAITKEENRSRRKMDDCIMEDHNMV